MTENIKIEIDLQYVENLRAENSRLHKENNRLYENIADLRKQLKK